MEDVTHYIEIAFTASVMIFAAGGFYYYVPREFANIRKDLARVEKDAEDKGKERREQLEAKVDRNFVALDRKIDENKKDVLNDYKGLGGKVNKNQEAVEEKLRQGERDAARWRNNFSTALMLVAPPEVKSQTSGLLKEEAS